MIYFDNSATSSVHPEVVEAMLPFLKEEFGNPSSKYYSLAKNAATAVEKSREQVAKLIGAKPEEIIFTCGSTESTNMIIKGVCDYKKHYEKTGNHIITSKVEHHATLNVCKFLNGEIYSNKDATFSLFEQAKRVDRGYVVDFLDVNPYAQITPIVFENAIRENTIMASFIWANNEIGSINDMSALCRVAHKHSIPIHADATQIVGKKAIDVAATGIDFMSISAHKLHGPKGVGAAFVKGDDYGLPPMTALMHGGEQENGLRGGTLAVHNIVGFGKAAEIALRDLEDNLKKLEPLDQQVRMLIGERTYLELLGDPRNHLPGLFSIVVHDKRFDNERFIKRIGGKWAISTGSACTVGMPSHVLQAIGRTDETSKVLRLSLTPENTAEQVTAFLVELDRSVL
ncbi:MAG: cysteine desulfurase [Prevotella sp.]|nr:cysteine desulfurase [Prevotella sp.]